MSEISEEPNPSSSIEASQGWLTGLKVWAGVISIVVVPILVTGITQYMGWFTKNREYDIRMVEIGLSILRGDKGDKETSLPARRWALELLKEYSGTDIPEADFKKWAKTGFTPYGSITDYYFLEGIFPDSGKVKLGKRTEKQKLLWKKPPSSSKN